MKSSYARKMQDERRELLNRGLVVGEQYALDMMQICLHRQGWGYDRVKKLMDEIGAAADYYADALRKCMEQDIKQEQMDRELRDLVKDKQPFAPFAERYPEVITVGYDKLPRR